ncbi:MAG: hypothetical protein D3904_05760, partial [Candidatus Electrothrix sp. EH2]|nr:hypothetical protein [Candidatus Electrothrix sp. EH2]
MNEQRAGGRVDSACFFKQPYHGKGGSIVRKQSWKNGWTVAAMLAVLNSGGVGYAEETGMTWAIREYNSDLDISYLACYGQPGSPNYGPCNPYQGDTSCSASLPVLCLKVDGSPRPPYTPPPSNAAMNKEYYRGWAEGTAGLTAPVQGNTFATLDDVNAYCTAQLGPGYRAAEFHDGRWVWDMDENNFYDATWPLTTNSGGWGFYTPGQWGDESRFWVHINDQNANCWGSNAEPKGSIGDQVWADPDEDGNGLLDGDDYPLAGVNMRLYDSGGNLVRETETYVNGKYLFSNLDYGTYSVEIDQTSLPSNMQGNVAYAPAASVTIDASSPNNNGQDFAVYVPAEPRDGMTWALRDYNLGLDISYLACYGQPGSPNYGPCNPYQGDTSCSVPLPILCLKVDGSPRPPYTPPPSTGSMNKEYYHGWAEGSAELTAPIQGNAFATLNDVNAYCEAQLGPDYRAAEFHDGRWVWGMDENNFYDATWPQNTNSGGWGFYAPGQIPDHSRFWVYINDQDANCWGTTAVTYTVTSSSGEGGSISPDSDQTVDYGDTTSFTVTPDIGYSIDKVEGCNGSLSGNTYTTGAITADCEVTASFAININTTGQIVVRN